MKKFVMSLVLVLAFAGSAFGEVKEFGGVSIDVPAGWESNEQGPAVILIGPGETTMVMVISVPASGQNAKDIATQAATAAKGAEVKAEGDGYIFSFEEGGQTGTMYITVIKDLAIMATMVGDSPDLMKIATSVTPI